MKDIPHIEPETFIPEALIKWKGRSRRYHNKTVHFFIQDRKFESVWMHHKSFDRTLKRYEAIITPDFSLYLDMPQPVQIWNTYRNRWLGHYWQQQGLTVIPSVSWSDYESFEFCFSGLSGGVVALSTHLIRKRDTSFLHFLNGTDELITQIKPIRILCYGLRFQQELERRYPDLFTFYPYQWKDYVK